MHVVATAGHVDHGKSTLVRVLTGIDPDRLAEEKARGLTIDLGFAWTTLRQRREVAFVDVPGHVRFLKNMLAGVGAVDACLFVVAANEGWKPQSEEHLRILNLLGIGHGVVVLTKSTLASPEEQGRLRAEVEERLRRSTLEGAPIVATDALAGLGLEELRGILDDVLATTPEAVDRDRPRLWIDRAFAVAGTGTVVTGTLTGGVIRVGDELEIVPAVTQHRRAVRVRGIQTQKRTRTEAGPGNRVALGLTGRGAERLSHRQIGRGQAVVRPGQWQPTSVLDASLHVLEAAPGPVGRRGAYLAYFGSGEFPVQLRVLGSSALEPGGLGAVRLRLPLALPLLPGDRYVVRDAGRAATVGGGEVLDVDPVVPASRARPDRSVERVIAERGWVQADQLVRLTGERRPPTLPGGWIVDPGLLAAARNELVQAVASAGNGGLDVVALDGRRRAVLSDLEAAGTVAVRNGRARLADRPSSVPGHPYLEALEACPFAPPDPAAVGVDRSDLRQLVLSGSVVERDGHYFSARAVDRASVAVAELLAQHPDGVTVSLVRERLGTTRKHVVPLLNLLDAEGITRRRGERRIAGPRLPAVGGAPTGQNPP